MTTCRQCGLTVVWQRQQEKTPPYRERMFCYNPDGSDHWDLCSKTRTARIVASGEPFQRQRRGKRETGYTTPLKNSGELLMSVSVPAKGCAPKADCRQCLPPWEICAECPIRLAVAA